MKEVFKKIANEIRSFIELHRNDDRVEWTGLDWLLKKDDVIKIIETVAEEYNNGWIPVEEDKPVLYTKVLITYKTCEGEKVCEGRYNGTYWYDSDTRTKLKAIAWQPLPSKYQPKGDWEYV